MGTAFPRVPAPLHPWAHFIASASPATKTLVTPLRLPRNLTWRRILTSEPCRHTVYRCSGRRRGQWHKTCRPLLSWRGRNDWIDRLMYMTQQLQQTATQQARTHALGEIDVNSINHTNNVFDPISIKLGHMLYV